MKNRALWHTINTSGVNRYSPLRSITNADRIGDTHKTMKFGIPFISCIIAGYAHSAAVITEAIFDPGATELINYGDLELSGSETLTFNMETGTMSINGSSVYSANSVNATNTDSYYAFAFDNFSIGETVTIDVTWGNTPPPNGLAILATGNFTLNADLTYSDPSQAQAYEGGNISLVSRGDMVLNSIISADGATGKGSNKNGQNGGTISIATGSNLDANGAVISSTGGNGFKTNSNDGGNGGVVDIYANSITGLYDDIEIYTSGGNGSINGLLGSASDYTDLYFPTVDLSYIVTTAIPEPSSTAMLMLCSLGLLSRRRRESN